MARIEIDPFLHQSPPQRPVGRPPGARQQSVGVKLYTWLREKMQPGINANAFINDGVCLLLWLLQHPALLAKLRNELVKDIQVLDALELAEQATPEQLKEKENLNRLWDRLRTQ